MKKNNIIKSLLATTLLAVSMTGWLGYNNHNNQKEIEQLQQEQVTILIQYNDLISNLNSLEYELNTYKDTNVDLKEKIDTKNKEIKELKTQVSIKKEEAKKKQVVVSRGTEDNSTTKVFEVTFYSADFQSTGKNKGDKGYGITASGKYVQEGRTIACPKSMEFGTKVHIDGVGYRTCEDRGGAITEGYLDVYVDSQSKAMELGRNRLQVRILNN